MAKYNTFLVMTTKGKPLLVTSSARKARKMLLTGVRVEVWNANSKAETIYNKNRSEFDKYVAKEREYIRAKQQAAEQRNHRRKQKKPRTVAAGK